MPAASSPSTRVVLHIGPPKTGTTYLQGVLRDWHSELREAGVLFPAIPTRDHFNAALDLRGSYVFGAGAGRESVRPRAHGAWSRLVGATLRHRGTVVISHELFATADADHARRALEDLAGTDLHVVVTARDPARQLVSSWQERVKHGSTRRFGGAARRLMAHGGLGGSQDLTEVLRAWSQGLPADHVHVVTVPPEGTDPTLLWRRFATLLGVDAGSFDPDRTPHVNESLGVAEIELLRRVNVALGGRVPHPAYTQIVTALYANRILAGNRESPAPRLPDRLWTTVEETAVRWIEFVQDQGYDVVGDLDELRPRPREGSTPDEASERAVAAAAVRGTAELLVSVAALHRPATAARTALRGALGDVAYAAVSQAQRARFGLSRAMRRGVDPGPEPPITTSSVTDRDGSV